MSLRKKAAEPPEEEFEVEAASRALADRARQGQDFETWFQEQVRRTPWWAISLAGHAMLMAFLTVITFSTVQAEVADVPIIIGVSGPTVKPVQFERPESPVNQPGIPTGEENRFVNDDPIIYYPDAKPSDHIESDDGVDAHTMKGQDKKFLSSIEGEDGGLVGRQGGKGPGLTDVIGVSGGGGGAGRFGNGPGGRAKLRKEGSGGKNKDIEVTDFAVRNGLHWLARHQGEDGGWDADTFDAQCKRSICDGRGHHENSVGVTGLALLAFLGAGYTHNSHDPTSRYTDPVTGKDMDLGAVVKKGIIHLIQCQDVDGAFGPLAAGSFLYNHSIAALALAEAYGLTQCPLFKDPAQRGINFLIAAKNPYKAWRYHPHDGENDVSVTGWCVMALKSAKISGLEVSEAAFQDARGFINEVTEKNYGKVGYRTIEEAGAQVKAPHNGDYAAHDALTAVGMVCRAFIDHDAKDPLLELGAKVLANDLPVWDKGKKTNDYYYWYYGSLALFQFDGPDSGREGIYWKRWNAAMQEALLKHQAGAKEQCAAGSWDADDRWGVEGAGRVYATAINVLTLEVYYRYECAFGVNKRK